MRTVISRGVALFIMLMTTAACSKGGNLVLEPGARPIKSKGSPFVNVNQGGKALLVQEFQTVDTGVHGFVSIQPMSSRSLSSGSGHTAIINKVSPKQ